MRIACLYGDIKTCGRNDGGPLYYTHNLRKIFGNDNISHIFPHGDLKIHGKFDYYLMVDWGEDALGYEKFEIPHPSIYITSDTHLGFDYRLSRAKRCDYVFCNQRKAVEDFARAGVYSAWLPHAFDPWAYSPGIFNETKNDWDVEAEVIKKYDISFVGNLNDENRVRHLDSLFKAIPNFYWGNQRFHEAARQYNQSKIVFNVSARRELNMRHFESLGCRSFLLSDRIPEEENVFKSGVHFVAYDDLEDMIEKAKYYLDHDRERLDIAQAGYEEACSKHSYLHRVIQMLDVVGIPYDKDLAASLLPKEKLVEV